jgi:hypothetical protein
MDSEEGCYCIGLDPQPSLLAISVLNPSGVLIQCFAYWFKKKTSFKTAGDWEVYICGECNLVARSVVKNLKRDGAEKIVIAVEQQRSRINSIVESSVTTAFLALDCHLVVPHPQTWKKSIHMATTGNNADNKKMSEDVYGEIVRNFYKQNKMELPKRIHDLCDSLGIAKYLYNRVHNGG